MAKKKGSVVQPSEFELQVLGVLWEHGPGTVRQVLEWLADGKPRAYTSVLSVMQVMHKKGLLGVEKQSEGLAHVFSPMVSREHVVVPLLKGLVAKIFGSRAQVAVQQLMNAEPSRGEEIHQLRALLDQIEARRTDSTEG
ncbi:MAG: blaI 10 [Planctomycetaceae bacterium]|nr:blaI 10 [Planctomycetaceae bacterium]